MKKKVWLSACIICGLILSACTLSKLKGKAVTESIPQDQDTLLLTPDFSYEVTTQLPNIRVDMEGYLPESKKTAFFYGNDLNTRFWVINTQNNEPVFEGSLKSAGTDIYSGDFTNLTTKGNYVIKHEKLGYSYPFSIGEGVYQDMERELFSSIHKYSFTRLDTSIYVMANLIMTSEIYPQTTSRRVYLKGQLQKLMNAQDSQTGAFGVEYYTASKEVSLSNTAKAAGVLAQFAFQYKGEDTEFADICILASKKAYDYMEKYRDNIASDAWYYAAAQLYRTTGQYTYRKAIQDYDSLEHKTKSENDFTLIADIAYLTTSYRTDFARCNTIMEAYLAKAQDISLHSARENLYVFQDIDSMEESELIEDMMILGIVNYVLSGREYEGIQENYVHYFLGVNQQAQNRMTAESLEESVDKNVVNASRFLFILGNLGDE